LILILFGTGIGGKQLLLFGETSSSGSSLSRSFLHWGTQSAGSSTLMLSHWCWVEGNTGLSWPAGHVLPWRYTRVRVRVDWTRLCLVLASELDLSSKLDLLRARC